MRFFDENGKILKQRGKKTPQNAHYYDTEGELRPVPEIDDSKEDILNFLIVCMQNKVPGIDEGGVDEIWKFMENKKKLVLRYLAALKEKHISEGDKWRSIAYSKAIRAIKESHLPIASGEQAMMLPGVGKSIGAKIEEILTTGELQAVDARLKMELERQSTIELFMGVWGIGPKKANMLYDQGYRDLEELEDAPLTEQEKIGLKYYNDFQEKIPRAEIEKVRPTIEEIFFALDSGGKFCICGSFRRGVASSGDIDILISSSTIKGQDLLKMYVAKLHRLNFLSDDLAMGPTKYMGVAQIGGKGRRIDIRSLPYNSWGTGVLYFTGSGSFNEMMRAEAKRMGFMLSEYNLKNVKTEETIFAQTEKEIFKALGMKYVPPEKRN